METRRLPLETYQAPGAASAMEGDTVEVGPPLDKPLTGEEIKTLRDKIIAALHTCFDPEIPVNIYELGLIYEIEIAPSGAVIVRMTLTSPACPAAASLPSDVQRKIQMLAQVTSVRVDLVWDPPWDKDRMSEAAKLQLGIED